MNTIGNGNLTEKGKIILKEMGMPPEDIEERPLDYFRKKHEFEEVA